MVGALAVAVLLAPFACARFSADDPDVPHGDSGVAPDAGADAMLAPDAAGRWCDGGHELCVDFDDLAPGDPPNSGWEASRDMAGSTLTLVQSGALSAPNAVQIDLANAAKTFVALRRTTEAGAPVRQATLTYSVRLRLLGDGAMYPNYNIGRIELRSAAGAVVGYGYLGWQRSVVHLVGYGSVAGGNVVPLWELDGGVLSLDKWLGVTLVVDVTNRTVSATIRDSDGFILGTKSLDGISWPEVQSVSIEIGAATENDVRPPLRVTFDNVALDLAR